MAAPKVDPVENRRRMEAGELYYCFTPELIAERRRAFLAYTKFNKADDVSRREGLELLKEYLHDPLQFPESIQPFAAAPWMLIGWRQAHCRQDPIAAQASRND